MKALNTMDTLITENGRTRVRHYLLDVGSTFGMGANGPHEWTEGYEYLFEGDKLLKRLVSLRALPSAVANGSLPREPVSRSFRGRSVRSGSLEDAGSCICGFESSR